MAASSGAVEVFEGSTRDAHRIQMQTLRSILERNAAVGYLRRFLCGDAGFPDPAQADPAHTAAAFRRLVPLSSYDDYADLIDRIADGAEPPTALSVDPLLCFFNSSGTSTSNPKLIPYFDSSLAKSASSVAHQTSSALLQRLFPPRRSANKVLWFLYAGNVTATEAGYKVMAASAFPFHNNTPTPSPLLSMCVSPREVIVGADTLQQMYCHLLCGLSLSASVDCIRAPYAAGLIRAIRMLESKWMQLCDDIEYGSLSSEITEPSMRVAVQELLGAPQPELATRIREICMRNNWRGILCRLWPKLCYIACVSTGSMEQYFSLIKHYAGDNLPLLGGDYFASECPIGINMDRSCPPATTSFVIIPSAAYFEFLPFELGASPNVQETVDISGVEVQKMYEVVVTTYRGLYRYRLNDVVKVVGFYNSSPRVEFITRAPKEDSEVFTERDLISAMSTLGLMIGDGKGGEIVEFAGYLDPNLDQGHVIIFVELDKDCLFLQRENVDKSIGQLSRCCQSLEACLGSVYKVKRAKGNLGLLELSIVKPGSFEGLARMAIKSGAPANQYKPAKILRTCNFVNLLKENVILSSASEPNI
ncbi:probable indole-3-acetic acid-amido synthetase GH3.6 [Zingiber officinale]|uniref:probable indole-3-acetic acid-amido synthetase GH3.6 n=1 Tax=Zingiber officinale TaxID=94328 RepID=UPI001C4C56B8|nr:probable indole-3-acetic acid-amido synthetase GH3.6 [Zingiber officinale]